MADATERADQMVSLSRVLQGLSYPSQILSAAREVDGIALGWAKPPRIARTWSVIAEQGIGTFARALEGIGLRCGEPTIVQEIERIAWKGDGPAVHSDYVELESGDVCASLVLRRWPREVAPGWLGHALAAIAFPVDVGIHILPQDPLRLARFLRKQQTWQTDTGMTKDAANTLGRNDAERTREKLIARTDRPVKVAVVLTVRASTYAELRARMVEVRSEMTLALADVREATFEQDRAFLATQPAGRCDLLSVWRTLDCTSVASTWPFQPVTISHVKGAKIGVTHEADMLVQLDPFDPSLRSFSGLLTGSVGSGKSYFLKLLLRHISDEVEIRIVEHSDPPEYDGIPRLMVHSVAELSEAEQATQLRQYISDLWALARSDPRPRLLVLDELWSVLRRPELADLVEEIARRGRKYGLALWIATQQVEELIEAGKPVFDNAAIKIYLQQEDRDLAGLAKAANLTPPARRLLRTAARGQALIQCGKMVVLVDVQASPDEHEVITTDPREEWARIDSALQKEDSSVDEQGDLDDSEAGSPGGSMADAWVHRGGDRRGSPVTVDTAHQ